MNDFGLGSDREPISIIESSNSISDKSAKKHDFIEKVN
jgi:hypothetical protein